MLEDTGRAVVYYCDDCWAIDPWFTAGPPDGPGWEATVAELGRDGRWHYDRAHAWCASCWTERQARETGGPRTCP